MTIAGISAIAQSISPEVLSSAGRSFRGVSIQIDWTLGETAITSLQTPYQQITQGFHQPHHAITNDLPEKAGQIIVFPNPTQDVLQVEMLFIQDRHVHIQLYDVSGKLLWTREVSGQSILQEVNLSTYPNGNYLLCFSIDQNEFSQSFKIQKVK